MDVRIGVTYTAKELDIELPDDTKGEDLQTQVDKALADGVAMLWLTDKKGRRFGVPSEKLAYIEIGSPEADRRIGFGS